MYSAIEWIMERYVVTRDDASGIVNDPNAWADEHGNPWYILDLLLSVITVSMKTMEIVESAAIRVLIGVSSQPNQEQSS